MKNTKLKFIQNSFTENLAYILEQNNANPAAPLVIFLNGFKSDMNGTKAVFLSEILAAQNIPFLRLDYSGHGESEGEFENGSIKKWTADALCVIDFVRAEFKFQNALLIGSSMGAWIALHVSLARADFIKSLITLAAAPDFTTTILENLTAEQKILLQKIGEFEEPSRYGGNVKITQKFLEESKQMCLLDAPIALSCPATLIHGTADEDVPFERTNLLAKTLKCPKIEVFLRDGSDHRLSSPDDLEFLKSITLDRLKKIV